MMDASKFMVLEAIEARDSISGSQFGPITIGIDVVVVRVRATQSAEDMPT